MSSLSSSGMGWFGASIMCLIIGRSQWFMSMLFGRLVLVLCGGGGRLVVVKRRGE